MKQFIGFGLMAISGCSSAWMGYAQPNDDHCTNNESICDGIGTCDADTGRCVAFPPDVELGCGDPVMSGADLRDALLQARGAFELGRTAPYRIALSKGCEYSFTMADNHWFGPNALPVISHDIEIDGRGATLSRIGDENTSLRFFYVAGPPNPILAAGRLVLRNLQLRNGRVKGGTGGSVGMVNGGGGGAGLGGAIFSHGKLALYGVSLVDNRAIGGAGAGGGASKTNPGGGGGGMGGDAGTSPVTQDVYYGTGGGGFRFDAPGCSDGQGGGFQFPNECSTASPVSPEGGARDGTFGVSAFGPVNPDQRPETGEAGQAMRGGSGGGQRRLGGSGGQQTSGNTFFSDGGSGGNGDSTGNFNSGGGGGAGFSGNGGGVTRGTAPSIGGGGGALGGGGGGGTSDDKMTAGGGGGGGVGGGGGGGGWGDEGIIGSGGGGGFGGGGDGGKIGGSGGFGGGGGASAGSNAGGGGFGGGRGSKGDASMGGSSLAGGGGGGLGAGGAIFVHEGSLVAANCSFLRNTAAGGPRGGHDNNPTGGTNSDGSGLGGAIFNLNGSVELDNVTVADNATTAGTMATPLRVIDVPSMLSTAGVADGRGIYSLAYGAILAVDSNKISAPTARLTLKNSLIVGGTASQGTPAGAENDIIVHNATDVTVGGSATFDASQPNRLQTPVQTVGDSVTKKLDGVKLGGVTFTDESLAANQQHPSYLVPKDGDELQVGDDTVCKEAPVGGQDQLEQPRPAFDCTLGAIETNPSDGGAQATGCSLGRGRGARPWFGLALLTLLALLGRRRRGSTAEASR